ncbi:hypothetical protein ABZ793_33965 [Micromonospora sp. NPDC047465]|uniref:hypothetical protein n=1 Tax=Micromonospora sp. NPDC047465 TaxID=3154813 RepID=UPI0033E482D5
MDNTLITELYLGEQLGWVDVSDDVREVSADSGGGITITRTEDDPGTMDLVMANRGGRYSPRNPRSPYYGLLGRNTPIRSGLALLVDDFGRTVAEGWGSGWWWFGAGGTVAASDTTVVPGAARHLVPSANAYRGTYYDARSWRDAEVRVTVDLDGGDITGGAIEPANILFRMQDIGTYYMARVEVSATEVVTVSLHHSITGVIAAAVVVAGLTFTGQPLAVAASCVADRLCVKVWDPAGGEPRDWQLTAVDDQITEPGHVGIRSGVAGGNTNTKPIRFTYADLRVIDRRACMEVSAWPPRWNTPGTDTWVPVQAAGILRRLNQGAKPLDSALFRAYATASPPPIAWWPLEDSRSVDRSASGLPGQPPITELGRKPGVTQIGMGDVDGAIVWGVEGSGGAASLASLRNGGRLAGPVPASSATSWTFEFVIRYDAGTADGTESFPMTLQAGDAWEWSFVFAPAGTVTMAGGGSSGVGVSVTGPFPGWDGYLHHVRLDVERNGANSDHFLWVDGALVGSGTWFGVAAPVPDRVLPNSYLDSGDYAPAIGHLALFAPHAPYYDTTRPAAAQAWLGELAADRIERLCAEQGVQVSVTRGPDPSAAMGPQRPDTFLALLRECDDVDGGMLGEAREQLGLTYRCLGALYNQTPVALDYRHLAPPLEPTDDDDHVRNDVTVSRPDGGSARVVQETGPLSVQPPPAGVGTYDTALTVNVVDDGQLPHQAGWRVHVGTWDEARYPVARVNLAAPMWQADPDRAALVAALADGDVVALDGLPDWLPPGPVLSMVRGSVEHVDEVARSIDWTWTPAGPYTVAQADGDSRVPADGSTLAVDLTEAGTSLLLASTPDNGVWTQDPADMPLDVRVGGERVTASKIEPGLTDTFVRTVSNGWGSADSGQPYATSGGSPADFDVAAGLGRMHLSSFGHRSAQLGLRFGNIDIRGLVKCLSVPTGAPIEMGIAARFIDTSNLVDLRVFATTSNAITVSLRQRVAGVEINTGFSVVPGTTATSTMWWRLQAFGAQLRAKAWPTSQPEPESWTATLTTTWLTPGDLRFHAGLNSGNTNLLPVTVQWDDITMSNPQLVTLSARSANGVRRSWPAGTQVDVWDPAIIPL